VTRIKLGKMLEFEDTCSFSYKYIFVFSTDIGSLPTLGKSWDWILSTLKNSKTIMELSVSNMLLSLPVKLAAP